jgi:hypothetical protein
MKRILSFLKRLHPFSIFFFASAVYVAFLGLLNGFQHKVLNVIVVVANVFGGLLVQWLYEKGWRE